ncbi:MAG: DUF2779 domain-containing protein [Candidatus Omnitrophica bacterium]|nr:DUF2779 domain-containing protein [Candidatus Omnitrophota bacterium]
MNDQELIFQEGNFDIWSDSEKEDGVGAECQKLLTKSKYLNATQCSKYLWIRCNAAERIPKPSESLKYIFDIGNEIGRLAKQRFPGGIDIRDDDFKKNIEQTKQSLSLQKRKPIYEAGIVADRLYARADILVPIDNDAWDIVEVKCSTKVKTINYDDVAFQRYVYEKAGLNINRCYLMYINNQYVRQGDIDINELFILKDITEQVCALLPQVNGSIKGLLDIIDMDKCPSCGISEMCFTPYDCPLQGECWEHVHNGSIFEFHGMRKKKKFEMYDSGVVSMAEVSDSDLKPKHIIQKRCSQQNSPYIDKNALSLFLDRFKYPLYYMDFETVLSPIPRFVNARPYQQISFQFSVHIQNAIGQDLIHNMFLARYPDDPRKEFLEKLQAILGEAGSIIVYYAPFERTRLKEFARDFPEYEKWIYNIIPRIIDLRDPFSGFWFYHPSQGGNASIKKVLPALTGTSYEGMEISDGGCAFREYARVTYNDVPEEERQRVYTALEKYCELDTGGMVSIVNELRKMANFHK